MKSKYQYILGLWIMVVMMIIIWLPVEFSQLSAQSDIDRSRDQDGVFLPVILADEGGVFTSTPLPIQSATATANPPDATASATSTTISQTVVLPSTPEPTMTSAISPTSVSTATSISTPSATPNITPATTPTSSPSPTITVTPEPTDSSSGAPLITDVRNFIFGHSLLNHATGNDETTVPHWLHALAQEAEYSYAVDGQYGFLPQHAQLPPNPQWGFASVPGVWDGDSSDTFGDSDFTTVLLTAANFIQYQPATQPYDGDNPTNTTPVQATLEIIDWVNEQEPGIDVYIYENWPDMAGYLSAGFPPTAQEFAAYNEYTIGGFHTWWLDYYDELIAAQPSTTVRMIPVGPVISKLLTETELVQIPVTTLYEDDAPHGRPTIYFLASLVTYMGIYGEKAPADYTVPDSVDALVRDNYGMVIDFIWNELTEYGLAPVLSR